MRSQRRPCCGTPSSASNRIIVAKKNSGWPIADDAKRIRVISDNDYAGDPDGLVQLAHHLLSPTVDIVGVIGTHLAVGDHWGSGLEDVPLAAAQIARKIAELCKRDDVRIVAGARGHMTDHRDPLDSDGVRLIIDEAMRDDVDTPLYVVCGASLTEVASAWLIEPRIADRLTVVWIGGHEHPGAPVAPGAPDMEYNLNIDRISGQVVFNDSNLRIWQFPRNAYRQALASRSELELRMARRGGKLGKFLFERLGDVGHRVTGFGLVAREAYVLGDSPLVLATALQSMFESEPSSSHWDEVPCPFINDEGLYVENPNGRPLRVFTHIDNRVWLEDLYAKLELHTGM